MYSYTERYAKYGPKIFVNILRKYIDKTFESVVYNK
jgi:hypothetical protein